MKNKYANFMINVKLKMRLISFFNANFIRTSGRVWMIISSLMIHCFCGIVNRRKVFSLISRQNHCQRSWPTRISDTPQAGFESAQNLSSGLVEWSYVVMITTTPRRHCTISTGSIKLTFGNKLEKLILLFISGSWCSLNAYAKLVLEAYKKREQNLTQ